MLLPEVTHLGKASHLAMCNDKRQRRIVIPDAWKENQNVGDWIKYWSTTSFIPILQMNKQAQRDATCLKVEEPEFDLGSLPSPPPLRAPCYPSLSTL